MREEIIKRWQIIGATLFGAIFAGLGFLISWYQPIDGEPGYKLITPDDYSIIFGFVLAAVVIGFIGAVIGGLIGNAVGEKIASRTKKAIEESAKTEAYVQEQRSNLRALFYNIMTDKLFEKKEEALSTKRSINDDDLAMEALNETSEIVCVEIGFTYEQLTDFIDFDDFLARLQNEEYTTSLLLKFEKMQKEEGQKLTKEINQAYKKLFLETLNEKKEAAQAAGQSVNNHALATEAMNETSMAIAEKFSLSYSDLAEIIDYAAIISLYGSG